MHKFNSVFSLHKKTLFSLQVFYKKFSTRRMSSCRIDHFQPNRPNQVSMLCKRARVFSQCRDPSIYRVIYFSFLAYKLAPAYRVLNFMVKLEF